MNCGSLNRLVVVHLAAVFSLTSIAVRGEESPSVVLKYEIDPSSGHRRPLDVESLVTVVRHRVRNVADVHASKDTQIEIVLRGKPSRSEVQRIKKLLGYTGVLEFRILADKVHQEDRPIIEQARATPLELQEVKANDEKVAEWTQYSEDDLGPVDKADNLVKRKTGAGSEVLVLADPYNVTGDYLTAANVGTGDQNLPAIHFSLNPDGAARLEKLTRQKTPKPATPDSFRRLALILDKHVVSAPTIRTVVSSRVAIGGGSMTKVDADTIVEVLNEGQLPYNIRLIEERHTAPQK